MKITRLQSASMCWDIIGPTTKKPSAMRSCTVNAEPTTVLQGSKSQSTRLLAVILNKQANFYCVKVGQTSLKIPLVCSCRTNVKQIATIYETVGM